MCGLRAVADDPLLVVPSPAGEPFTHELAEAWAGEQWLVFACGRYEGIDARVVEDAARPASVFERCPSATTSSTAARSRRWRSSRRSGACCPASWATRPHWLTSRTRMASWRLRRTPSRPPGGGATSPRCCSRATTPRSRGGGGMPRCAARAGAPRLIERLELQQLDDRDLETCWPSADGPLADGRFRPTPGPVAD